MSCTHVLCTLKTNYLTTKVAIKRLYNHRRSTEDSEDEFCMEVHVNEVWVWDYKNSGEDTIQPAERAFTEPKEDEDTTDRVVVSRVAITTGPGLDLDNIIAKKDDQLQNMPPNKTNETSPTGIARAEDSGVSETGQIMVACKMDGNIVAIQHRVGEVIGPTIARTVKYPSDIREQMPQFACGSFNKNLSAVVRDPRLSLHKQRHMDE